MFNTRKYFNLIILTCCLVILSCNLSINAKKKLSIEIANESCSLISEITSNMIVDAIDGSTTDNKNTNLVPGYWCECYTYYISDQLMEKFTVEELKEIHGDNIKKLMVLSQIFTSQKENIQKCIEITTNEKIKNYAEFEIKLNKILEKEKKE